MAKKPTYEELEKRVKELEVRFQEQQNIYDLLNNAPKGIFLLDLSGKLLFANRMGANRLGKEPKEIIGTTLREYFPSDIAEKRRLKGIEALKGGSAQTLEDYIDDRWYYSTIFPIRDKDGNQTRLAIYSEDITDRKRAEEALRESGNFLQSIFDGIQDGISVLDRDLNIVKVNAWMEQMYDEKRPLVGRKCFEVYQNRASPCPWCPSIAAMETGEVQSEIVPYPSKEKPSGWIELSCFPIRDADGKVANVIEHVKDITAKKQAEEALRAERERFQYLSENAPFGMAMIGHDGTFKYINPKFNEIFGYDLSDVPDGKTWFRKAYPDPDYRHHIISTWLAELTYSQIGQRRPRVLEVECKDGSKKIINFVTVQLETGENLMACEDITSRRQAEEALQESEEKFRSLSENAPDIVGTLAFDGSFTYVNPAWEAILGHEPKEVLGKYFTDFVKQEEAREYVRIFKNVRDNRTAFKDIDVNIIHKDGSARLFSASGAPNVNNRGEVTGMVGLFKDITEQRKLEKQYRHSQRMEAIGTLAGGIAHDFNNLLMGIQGRTSLMLMDAGPSHPYSEHLKGIEGYVESAADLTKQLLGFARGGKYEVKPIDINELIKTGSRMFGRTQKEIKIHWKYQKDVWTIEADRGQIEQVLMNLYVNAWQAMPSGGALYLQTENVRLDRNYVKPFETKPGKYVKISVTDTGVGMDEATRQRAFDPFFTTKEMGRGTGLGLASAYGIIKNHGGFITVYSEKGRGATFNVYLPASEKEVIEAQEVSEALLKGSETILLVDDEDMIVDVAKKMLEQMGYEVLTAGGGREAIDIYEKNKARIDIVILDMIMPDMNGGDTYDRMKEIDPDVKVLLSSGYSINGDATEIMDRGCNAFIQKPFNIKQLSRKLRGILDKE